MRIRRLRRRRRETWPVDAIADLAMADLTNALKADVAVQRRLNELDRAFDRAGARVRPRVAHY